MKTVTAGRVSKKAASSHQIAFRYRLEDSQSGVSRTTAQSLAVHLGVDETQAIHLALREMASRLLPQYPADDGPLSQAQTRQIRKLETKGLKSVRSSLFDTVSPKR